MANLELANGNLVWSQVVAESLYRAGVQTVCISPGSRSTPLVVAIAAHPHLEALVHIDERSGSFFALGLAKSSRRPVALLCTSGTAAANYFPAIIEAYYSHVPLVVLTADRPPELRDCGAGQTIDQLKIYGGYVRYFFEVGQPEMTETRLRQLRSLVSRSVQIAKGEQGNLAGAVHLNFAFADPLAPIPGAIPADILQLVKKWDDAPLAQTLVVDQAKVSNQAIVAIAQQISQTWQGVIVVGVYGNAPQGLEYAVQKLAKASGYALLVEATGMPRRHGISTYDSFLRSPVFRQTHVPELVIRFGAMPTSKAFGEWLAQYPDCPQIVIGGAINNDPSHGNTNFLPVDPIDFSDRLSQILRPRNVDHQNYWRQQFKQIDIQIKEAIAQFLQPLETLFEGKIYAELATWLPQKVQIFIASSTPIRDLDTFFHGDQPITVLANRGANGIDGTLSAGLGAAWSSEHPTILITGDLGFYHDLNGLMAAKQYSINLTVILINNNGGGIFEMLAIAKFEPPFEEFFATPHGLDFAPIVTAYGCGYEQIRDWQHFRAAVLESLPQPGTKVLEIRSDRQHSHQLRQQLQHLLQNLADQN